MMLRLCFLLLCLDVVWTAQERHLRLSPLVADREADSAVEMEGSKLRDLSVRKPNNAKSYYGDSYAKNGHRRARGMKMSSSKSKSRGRGKGTSTSTSKSKGKGKEEIFEPFFEQLVAGVLVQLWDVVRCPPLMVRAMLGAAGDGGRQLEAGCTASFVALQNERRDGSLSPKVAVGNSCPRAASDSQMDALSFQERILRSSQVQCCSHSTSGESIVEHVAHYSDLYSQYLRFLKEVRRHQGRRNIALKSKPVWAVFFTFFYKIRHSVIFDRLAKPGQR